MNLEQQEAVLKGDDGPLLVIAGAGTGKTRVIAHRIAFLLATRPDLTPANLLALTFSRKAAHEMRERVEALLGTTAEELGAFTFHGFCHRFLQDHAFELGHPTRFRLLDRVESWELFRELLPELKPTVHVNLGDPTDGMEGFLRFIGRAKDELVGCDDFAAFVRGISDFKERARCQEVERAYRIYQERLRASGALDFGDLIGETLKAFEEKPALLAELTAQYRYVLVDEFQDTNVAQIALLKQMVGEGGRLCVVGDDDQAIYRFRGASFASFLLLKEAFPNVRTVRLTQNYRSTPQILSVADRLIRHNEPDRYDPKKRLWTENPPGEPVRVALCRDEWHETGVACDAIRALYEAQPAPERRFDRIAVLYRAHAHRDRLVEVLRKQGIPFYVQGGIHLLDQPEIKELISFLRVLNDPADSVSLFQILSHPIWGIPTRDLVSISRWAKEREISLRELIESTADLAVSGPTKEALLELKKEFQVFERRAFRSSVKDLIPQLVEETSLRAVFQLPSMREGDPWVSLGRFLHLVYRYAEDHPEAKELRSFLRHLEVYERIGEDPREEEEEAGADRVRLMTIHQAKGLEFDWVILLGLLQGRFPTRNRPEPIPFPLELMKERLPQGDYHLQEERRLCYVACTRARRGLILLTQERAHHRPSTFIREMEKEAPSEEIERQMPETPVSQPPSPSPLLGGSSWAVEREVLQCLRKIRRADSQDEAGFSEALRRMTELAERSKGADRSRQDPGRSVPPPIPEKFSFTQLTTYRYCPLRYQYGYVYRIPVPPTPQMSFGVDLHVSLEEFFKEIMKGQVSPLQELLDRFHRRHTPGRYGDPYQDGEYQRLGKELLIAFYRKHEGQFPIPLFVEKAFSLQVGDAWIRGVVDRIDRLESGGVEIIDYKSGKPKGEADADEQLQLRLYALAAQEVFGLDPQRLSFYYLRNNEKLTFEPEVPDQSKTKEKIHQLIAAIRSGDFTPTPSQRKCRRCDYRNLCPASLA